MFNEQIKRIEDNAISMLRMIPKRDKESNENVKDFLKDVFESQNTMLSDVLLNRLARFITNEIRSGEITRQNADSVLLMTLKQIGFTNLSEEYKEVVK